MTTSHAEYARACADYDPDEAPFVRVLYDGTPVARHGHACDGCGEAGGIQPGGAYTQVIELEWGRFGISRYCFDGCRLPDQALPPRPPAPLGPDELPF